MNTERLYSIAKRLTQDMSESNAGSKINTVIKLLRVQMSSPSAENLSQLEAALNSLDEIQTNHHFDYPETWNSTLEHIGATDLKNALFAQKVKSAVRGNSITLDGAVTAVSEIHTKVVEINQAMQGVITAFDALGIEAYELEDGEAELSVLMPREGFDNSLEVFAKETIEISRFFELAEEMSTGSRTKPILDELSTTDPIIIAGVSIPACLFVLKIIREVVDTIKSTYELREARAKALLAEASQKSLKSIDDDIQSRIDAGLKEIVENRISENKSAVRGRTSELRIELNRALPRIAARIDNGVRIEGAAFADGAAEDSDGEGDDVTQAATEINRISSSISYAQLPSEPVLQITVDIVGDD